ncbi:MULTISPECIES: asparagine synthetase A [Acidiplasma]|jgi:asparaginyl-tRNA synthetase|uniref:Asparagine synthetase n=3 Tax=Acidiplasma TaxID=507753 RepID=A0A0Q0RYJ9_9ARCH|nr:MULTISPECIES: asparagine synthetase A [Acidiplasma]KQB35326.1 asparagine synthetase [Acidiplasma cupricumulans]KQB35371.1 asparagine synthetase [Acidiplasma aeolicum]WMT55614.1 MAG: asparagine synthetase A [Acidiplasma sp.]
MEIAYKSNDYVKKEVELAMKHLADKKVQHAIKVQSFIRSYVTDFLRSKGYIEISPIIISPLTDPLNHPVYDPKISAYGGDMWITKSMIFHKQIAVQELKKIFIMSPNIRLEKEEKAETGRHLYEFTQIDIEALEKTREDMMDLAEDLIIYTIKRIKEEHPEELEYFGRDLPDYQKPFPKITYAEAEEKYGKDFERIISKESKTPIWLIDIPLKEREFYDREYPDKPGILRDMDLIWPEGYQEASSGGEREYELDRIIERIHKKGQTEEQFKWFIELAKHGIKMSTGFGIGIERFTRFVCGLERIEDTSPFPKIPGKVSL